MAVKRPSREELLHPTQRLKDLARIYQISESTLHRWRRQAGCLCSTTGENHWNAKLTREDIKLIFELRKTGMLQREIAEKFNVAQPTISDILRRETWP